LEEAGLTPVRWRQQVSLKHWYLSTTPTVPHPKDYNSDTQ